MLDTSLLINPGEAEDSSLNRTKAKGKVLACRHAGSSGESKLEKGNIVKEAGGIGMILIDEADKDVAIPFTIPATTVGKRIGNKILAYINNTRSPTARICSAKTVLGAQPAPRVAAFSSRGPNSLTPKILKVIYLLICLCSLILQLLD